MRKYFILAFIILLNNINLFCQDIIDPPKLNQLDTLSILQREPDRFVRGWTCGSPGNMLDSAMFILGAGCWGLETGNMELGVWS